MTVFAIDPGTTESAYVQWDSVQRKILLMNIRPNTELLSFMSWRLRPKTDVIAIEMVASYGMPVGKEVFETVLWIGRFYERSEKEPLLVYRRDVKLHHCGNARAKDANIRQALIDKYGAPGTKREPGLTYGLKSHLWSAFALATFVSETQTEKI